MKITPSFLVSFETRITGLATGNWQRVAARLMWDAAMKTRLSATKVDILTFLLETAQIYPEGDGGNKRFDDMVAAQFSFENAHYGAGLELTVDEIEDNQLRDNPNVGALDYAAKWAKDIGAAAAYEPQKRLFQLISGGKVNTCYDGLSFFNAAHPINPNGGGGTYSNLFTAVPLVVTSGTTEQDNILRGRKNLGTVLGQIRAQRFFNGVPRFLIPSAIFCRSTEFDYTNLIVNAGSIGATDNLSAADPNDANKRLKVYACPELDTEVAGTYFVGCEDILSDELGAFIWSERKAFAMTQYGPMDSVTLKRMNKFNWDLDGRNVATYGHPYLFYRCEPV